DPTLAVAYNNRGIAYCNLRKYDLALADYNEAIRLDPNHAYEYRNRARLRAACPDARFRDGRRAFQDAVSACKLTHYRDAYPLGTLAAAYAESGDFAHAVEYQQKAIDLSEHAAAHPAASASEVSVTPLNGQDLRAARNRLALYRAGKPYREVPKPATTAVVSSGTIPAPQPTKPPAPKPASPKG
ncbi:MAG: tetratricopeptide repeat protein, partial [Planctomycetota bacterium]|nr:tetratricopeptide repeat protein [Planctomycetota bacterium]